MDYKMNLENKYFNLIMCGKKQIEMRLNKPERRAIKIGDTITFTNNQTKEELICTVVDKCLFDNFSSLYNAYPKALLGYAATEACSYTDMNMFYTDADIAKYGVVAIKIEPQMRKID